MADFNTRIAQYVALRDQIKLRETAHKKELKPFRETLEKLNAVLLAHLNSIGVDSVNSPAGVAYKSERTSASLEDPDAFMKFVQDTGAFELLDRKANVTAVTEFLKEHQSLPPGVKYTTKFVVGVNRGKETTE